MAWLLSRCRREQAPSNYSQSEPLVPEKQVHDEAAIIHALPQGLSRALLLPPREGDTLAVEMSKLGISFMDYAQHYYSAEKVEGASPPELASADQLEQLLGLKSPLRLERLEKALACAESRITAVRFLLSWSILRNINVFTPPERSLLPPEIAECIEASQRLRADQYGPLGKCSSFVSSVH